MQWDFILWLLVFILNITLLALLLQQILILSDLEADYMNPYETSEKVNRLVVYEFILQWVFSALFLLTGHKFMFLLTLPLALYHARLFAKGEHLLDVTEIFRALNYEKKLRNIKLAVYLFSFLFVIIGLVISLYNAIADEEDAAHGFWLF